MIVWSGGGGGNVRVSVKHSETIAAGTDNTAAPQDKSSRHVWSSDLTFNVTEQEIPEVQMPLLAEDDDAELGSDREERSVRLSV